MFSNVVQKLFFFGLGGLLFQNCALEILHSPGDGKTSSPVVSSMGGVQRFPGASLVPPSKPGQQAQGISGSQNPGNPLPNGMPPQQRPLAGGPRGSLFIDVQAKKFQITPMAFGGPNDELNTMVAADLMKAGLISPLPPFMGNMEKFLENPDFQSAGFYGPTALITFVVQESPSVVHLYVYSCGLQQKIMDEKISGENLRELAHKAANALYVYLTGGHEGYFTKKILHLLIRGKGPQKKNLLAAIHQDGQEGRILSVPLQYKTIRTLKAGPNGWIGYVADNGRGKTQLRLRHLASGQDEAIIMPGNVYGVSFSPCGGFLVACVAKNLGSDLWYYNIKTKEYRRLTFGSGDIINTSPTINAQGTIVFTSSLQGRPKLFSIQPNGSGLRCLSHRGGSYFAPTFSPKGDKVAFVYQSGGSFYLGMMNVTDGGQEKLFLQGHMMDSPSWLNDITVICSYQGARYGAYSFLVADIYGLSKYTLAIKGKPSVDMPSVLP